MMGVGVNGWMVGVVSSIGRRSFRMTMVPSGRSSCVRTSVTLLSTMIQPHPAMAGWTSNKVGENPDPWSSVNNPREIC